MFAKPPITQGCRGSKLQNSIKFITMITAKQEAFCQAVLAGRSQSDAYRHAYNTKRGATAGAIAVSASRLMADPKIAIRIAELRHADAQAACWTRRQSSEALKEIALSAACKPTERIAAIRELNAMFGYNLPEKVAADGQRFSLTVVRALEPIRDEDWL
jgi:phosphoenolpyruvate-protein kinase (PTS system EI component)